jgi:hypothetical protein
MWYDTNVSEGHVASIFRMKREAASLHGVKTNHELKIFKFYFWFAQSC